MARVDGLSRRQVQKWIANGAITVNGRAARKGRLVQPGDVIAIFRQPVSPHWPPQPDPDVPLPIVYQDDHLLVVEKRSGVFSVPQSPSETGTLAGGVVARFPCCTKVGRSAGDGGLVQRLDRETSGLVIVAMNQRVHDMLIEAQGNRGIEKTYRALVECPAGREIPSEITTPLTPAGEGRKKMRADRDGLACRTEVVGARQFGDWRLLEVTIHRGQRHQIRAHLSNKGVPIAGDALYRGKGVLGLQRLFLHAGGLRFTHPVNREPIQLHSPLPRALQCILDHLQIQSGPTRLDQSADQQGD